MRRKTPVLYGAAQYTVNTVPSKHHHTVNGSPMHEVEIELANQDTKIVFRLTMLAADLLGKELVTGRRDLNAHFKHNG